MITSMIETFVALGWNAFPATKRLDTVHRCPDCVVRIVMNVAEVQNALARGVWLQRNRNALY